MKRKGLGNESAISAERCPGGISGRYQLINMEVAVDRF
jgi:hypothetical protein